MLVPETSKPAGHTGESGTKAKGADPFKIALKRTATRERERRVE
jgi:hypothetical protein